jgi:putative hydrolase of the HAD superfamily
MSFRAVFFDAGETLVHPHPSFPELFGLVLKREGHGEIDPDRLREGLYLVAERFTRAAREGEVWSASAETSRAFWLDIYTTLLEKVRVTGIERTAEALYAEFTDLANYRLFPDVEPVLERLDHAGLTLGVVSNFEEWLERLLEDLGVTRYFDVRVISGVEGVEKPDPRIFLLALERTGARPEESIYVGDNPEFDTEPAESVGMTGVLIDRRNRFPDHPGRRIASLDELPALIGIEGRRGQDVRA